MPCRLLNSPKLRQRGFTLVELMIAMTIGLFLSGGVMALFIASKQSYRVTEAMSEVQERGRFALEFLARDLRQAGFRDLFVTPASTWTQFISGTQGTTEEDNDPDSFQIIYDQPDSSPVVWRTNLYSIAPNGDGEPGLRRRIDTSSTVDGTTTLSNDELMEGVYDMQVSYGRDTNGDQQLDDYVVASSVSDWTQVVAVRIDLLLRSRDNNLAETPMALPFLLNDGATTFSAPAGDRRIYQMFSTTIALRNQLP